MIWHTLCKLNVTKNCTKWSNKDTNDTQDQHASQHIKALLSNGDNVHDPANYSSEPDSENNESSRHLIFLNIISKL